MIGPELSVDPTIEERAARYAALGDPVRLAVIDRLRVSDWSPQELQRHLGIGSNLLAHHLDALERVGLIVRGRSSGDGRRRYVHLLEEARRFVDPLAQPRRQQALFICTANSARSQLAAALWTALVGVSAVSAGTSPAPTVHPGARAAAERAGIDLGDIRPVHISEIADRPNLVITVCDRAHEELRDKENWLHWSIPDPVPEGTPTAFDRTISELKTWIEAVGVA